MTKRGVSHNLLMLGLAALVMALPCGSIAAERVGEAVRISVQVRGQGGVLAAGDAIHRDERIRSNGSGTGAFVFADGTKLALGPNSSVVIDEYVYRGDAAARKLAIGATKGTLRWISGNSGHSAYSIDTPSGTLGVRGTAFDIYVAPDGLVAVALLTGAAEFCNAQGCQRLTRRCDVLIARPNGTIAIPRGVVPDLGIGRPGDDAFPFLSGKARLPRGFKAGSSCAGLSRDASGSSGNGNVRERGKATPPRGRDGGGNNPDGGGGNQTRG